MFASDVITEARFALSDSGGDRWSDARLLSLLNDALKDVALKTKLFNRRTYVKILNNVTLYDISEFALKIRRVEFDNTAMKIVSHVDMDRNTGWKTNTGTEPELVIYDKQDFGKFTSYPIITNTNFDNISVNTNYGIITDINYSDLQITPTDDFGILNPPNIKDYFYVYYVARHAKVVNLVDTLDVNEFYKELLANYVIARALKDNIDTQNREMGNEYFGLYSDRLNAINKEALVNFTTNKTTTAYRSME